MGNDNCDKEGQKDNDLTSIDIYLNASKKN